MTDSVSLRGEDVLRTTRPRVSAVVAVVMAVFLVGVGVLLLWVGAREGAAVGPGAACLVLAALSALLAALAFRVARGRVDVLPLSGPLMLVTILAFAVGFAGAALGIVLGAVTSSLAAIGAGIATFVAGAAVAVQGALVYGAARWRP